MTIPLQILLSLVLHIFLPLYFFGWLIFAKSPSLAFKIGTVALVTVYLLFLARAGIWHIFGLFWNYLYFGLYVITLIIVIYNSNTSDLLPKNDIKSWVNLAAVVMTFLIFLVWRMPQLYFARSFPSPAVELEFPLRTGEFLVVQGGSTTALNHHYGNRAQKFALDIVKIDRLGFRAAGLLPSALERYDIFNQPLYAPCAGKVIAIENNLRDLIPPATDSDHIAGNFVLLSCREHSILLAHLKQGSVSVLPGQDLVAGELIGRVGNSGNTSEPHLHIHAVKNRALSPEEITRTAEAAPILFNSKFLIRNDRLSIE